MPLAVHLTVEIGEVLEDAAFTAEDVARACSVTQGWVFARVETGLLQADQVGSQWRFAGAALARARCMAHLEAAFDADPQLAALTADLIEEVTRLRRRLSAMEGD